MTSIDENSPELRAIAEVELSRLGLTASPSILGADLNGNTLPLSLLCPPLCIYSLPFGSLLNELGSILDSAGLAGFDFIFYNAIGAVGSIHLGSTPSAKSDSLETDEIHCEWIKIGDALSNSIDQILGEAAQAKINGQSLRILTCPTLFLQCIWIKSDSRTNDSLIPITSRPAYYLSGNRYSVGEFESILQTMLVHRMKGAVNGQPLNFKKSSDVV